jgi:phenylacetate-coenzyme A ligase PaaK-like adenylate-forming protein
VQGAKLAGRIHSVLLSTDYVAEAVADAIEKAWGCQVYRHYGMTEMGLGGAVECGARCGYHFREADLLVEIVDPQTRHPVPNGTPGEIVFTTLTREGMPLIRYGTGDRAAFKQGTCPCGTALRTLDVVRGRWQDRLSLGSDAPLWIGHLDEALFGVEDVLCYQAALRPAHDIEHLMLYIAVREGGDFPALEEHIRQAVSSLPAVREACRDGRLKVVVRPAENRLAVSTEIAKRRIQDLRERSAHP